MDFNLFSSFTLGRRPELEAGLAWLRVELYQRMLDETAQIVAFADEAGFAGFGHPEHHLQIEGVRAVERPGRPGRVHRPALPAARGDLLRLGVDSQPYTQLYGGFSASMRTHR
ncbi:MAG: hypothetical protein OEW29_18565, partial [Acidimicrobiia bacterium]|nr:hypothetical protein [Acidimicrobiia bacterium]